MTENHPETPCYFIRDLSDDEGGFIPTGLSRSPWSPGALAGGPVSSLLAAVADEAGLDPGFTPARFSVDILGMVPRTTLIPRVSAVREGRQFQLHLIELLAAGRVAARAHLLRVRNLETPVATPPSDYPDPDSLSDGVFLSRADMAGAIRCKPVLGRVRDPGRGIVWMAMAGEVISGTPPSNFAKACLFADFGNGVGSATNGIDWTYANLDITLQFLRLPEGDWFLLDAETHMAGNGHGTASNIFADTKGVYARGFQTVFLAPGG